MATPAQRPLSTQTVWLALLMTVLLLLLGLVYAWRSPPPNDSAADLRLSTAAELPSLIVAALLQPAFAGSQHRTAPRPEASVILLDQTLGCPANTPSADRVCERVMQLDVLDAPAAAAGLPVELLRLLPLALREVQDVPPTQLPGVHLINAQQLNDQQAPFWKHFRQRFPAAEGFFQISQAVVSADRQLALLLVLFRCDSDCSELRLLLLQRAGHGWDVRSELRM
jgi:hypothetical protein